MAAHAYFGLSKPEFTPQIENPNWM
jgi:hypothetical protein